MIDRTLNPRGGILAGLFVCLLGLSSQILAQQTGQPPPAATPQTQPQAKSTDGSPADPGHAAPGPATLQNDRIFFALPNYLTVENATSMPPLSTGQKFKAVALGCFDPVEVAFIGIQAGIDQADNVNPTYRQGFIGYSKRYGTSYADAIIGNFGTGAIFPALLRQDPRYYQMGTGNFLRRATHAAMRIVITRGNSGKAQFNFSEFLGNGMAAGLSNTYHPGPHTLIGSTDVLETQLLMDTLGYELKEFWPDIHHLIQRHNH